VGILNYLGFKRPYGLGIASPWKTGELTQILVADLIGADAAKNLPMTRELALTIPAVSKGHNLLQATIAGTPLVDLDANGKTSTQPTWLYRTDTDVTPHERMAYTVSDLFFEGIALWQNKRGAGDSLLSSNWVPFDSWFVNKDRDIVIDGQVVREQDYCLINTPFAGLLNVAKRTLQGGLELERSWVGRSKNPIPLIELHVTDDTNLGKPEIKALVDAWALARTKDNGAIGYTPKGMEIKTHGEVKAELATEGRNALRTDIGSFINVRASMLDGTMGIDSLTYSTTEGEKNSFYEFDLPFWTDPIVQRLSMDDMTPRGRRVRFDFYDKYSATPNPTGTPTED